MKVVVDAVAVRPGSAAIVIGGVLRGWVAAFPGDELVVLVDGHADFPVPSSVGVEPIVERTASPVARLRAQSIGVRLACARHRADGLLSAIPASALLGARCPHAVIVYDLRHELRPAQFTLMRRLSRRVLWGWTFRRADALMCISERTRSDLVALHPYTRDKAVAALLGADHAAGRRAAGASGVPYVLAFGHFPNKNIDPVLRGWQQYASDHDGIDLRVCGLGSAARTAASDLVGQLGIGDRVELLPWLDDVTFEAVFAGAAAILFPSDFEGFGLPALEALLLGVPVVISRDPALLEVTGGHAVVAVDERPATLAGAISRALASSSEERTAGVAHAQTFTWERCASQYRAALARAAEAA
jgi:glycosyltransferase involved in cell wall biosynthesis